MLRTILLFIAISVISLGSFAQASDGIMGSIRKGAGIEKPKTSPGSGPSGGPSGVPIPYPNTNPDKARSQSTGKQSGGGRKR